MPRATSREMEPVGITSIGTRASSPMRMTEPLPNWRSIWASAVSRAFSRSFAAMRCPALVPVLIVALSSEADATGNHRQSADTAATVDNVATEPHFTEQKFDQPPTRRFAPNLARGGGRGPLPETLRDVEGCADRRPDGPGRLAVGQRPLDRPAAELGQHVVLGDALRIAL